MKTKTLEDEHDLQRNKGVNVWSGKIVKGTMNQAPIKLKVSSIPSKHQNIVYRSNSQSAFGDSTTKFFTPSYQDQSNKPGPGCYNLSTNFANVSSKKGSGFFASSTKLNRLQRSRSHVPGPGHYKILQPKMKKLSKSPLRLKNQSGLNSTQSTAMLSSQIQAHDLFKNQIKIAKNKPGVGAYELNPQQIQKLKNTHSAFKSKLQRFTLQSQRAPPVGLYQLSQQVKNSTFIKTKKHQNQTDRAENQQERQKNIENAIRNLDRKIQKEKIGPGTYNANLNTTTKTFKIKDNMYDRFGELKPIYSMAKTMDVQNQNNYYQQQKLQFNPYKNVTSMFKSTTKKWDIRIPNQMDPGYYNPNKSPPKKSHLINFMQKWV